MGRADYYKHGDANAICDRCGFKFKHSDLIREWTNMLVCGPEGNNCFEYRNAQDRLRAVRDRQTVPNARPEQADNFLQDNDVTLDDLAWLWGSADVVLLGSGTELIL